MQQSNVLAGPLAELYARAPRDRMPLSDRWVDRGRIGRRERGSRGALATAAAGRRFGVCVLGPRL